jgi:hypothetical protein
LRICLRAHLACRNSTFIGRKFEDRFHAAYRVVDGKASESGVGKALVGSYLNQIGLPDAAIIYVTSAPPEGIDWLTPEKAAGVGISYEILRAQAYSRTAQKSGPEPYDPMAAVTRFYGALSVADGEAAAAIVVPEKRGKGPFNEQSIHAFYGAMSKALASRPASISSATRSFGSKAAPTPASTASRTINSDERAKDRPRLKDDIPSHPRTHPPDDVRRGRAQQDSLHGTLFICHWQGPRHVGRCHD